ncbi:MAG: D-tyrosyl-tRNA(Tyr) deacylase [Ruminococcaceae bacterium]|nr:D-tyrosyl-tRNA(Tyr) deacylase [Oscillospiraceae bacterium]
MKAVIQRVTSAKVEAEGQITGQIRNGFLILLGVCENDTEKECKLLSDKIAKMRIFCDENDKMNLSLLDFKDSDEPYCVLVVSQFTLCANVRHGNRPDFFGAAKPDKAVPLYEQFMKNLSDDYGLRVEHGIFGADMKVSLLNDGPVTIIVDTDDLKK